MKETKIIEKLRHLTNKNPYANCLEDDVANFENLVISTDTTIESVHILPNLNPKFIAQKALARAFSDIICKGAQPVGYFLNLILPQNFTQVDEIIDGLANFQFQIDLLGGDTSVHNGNLILCITAIGKGTKKTRNQAKTDDSLFLTKKIGTAYSGFLHCQKNEFSTGEAREYLAPTLVLLENWHEVNASMDISDGLILDATRMAKVSQKCFEIDFNLLPFHGKPNKEKLAFGDDYNILFTSQFHQKNAVKIGQVLEGSDLKLINFPFQIEKYGFEHEL